MTTHKSNCTAELQNEVYQAWWTSHPNACKACDATGWVTSYDSVDYGSTTTSMQSDDCCEKCICNGSCPVCGGIVIFSDDEPKGCMDCDWTPDSGFRAPSAPECDCSVYDLEDEIIYFRDEFPLDNDEKEFYNMSDEEAAIERKHEEYDSGNNIPRW